METTTTGPKTWQEAYTLILQANNDGVGGNFFLADADSDGTPELYRLMNFRGNEVYVSDFARGSREVYGSLGISEMYLDKTDNALGIYHCDGGPADDFCMPHHECFGEYHYVDGKFISIALLVHNWATQDVEGKINVPELGSITLNGKDISLKDYETHAARFREKYSTSNSLVAERYCYEEGMNLNACWTR